LFMKISFTRKGPVIGAAASLALVAAALMTSAAGIAAWAAAPEVKAKPAVGKAVTRRLTPTQYRNIIDEVFGPAIELGGRFEPDLRVNELIEIGTGQVSVSSVGMAQFDTMARAIAAQVVGERNRGIMIPCKPQDPAAADDACAIPDWRRKAPVSPPADRGREPPLRRSREHRRKEHEGLLHRAVIVAGRNVVLAAVPLPPGQGRAGAGTPRSVPSR
jgi:hypothetical protein